MKPSIVMKEKSSIKPSASAPAGFEEEIKTWPLEKCFEELETIVAALEGESIPLEESLRMFERGMVLSRRCSTELTSIEKKIKMVIENSNGEPRLVDFEQESSDE